MIQLGVNIDHVATIRQARRTFEPDPVAAATFAQLGGADVITVHLREDRRHIQDIDVRQLGEQVHIKLNLEMAATDEMVKIAIALKPQMATLVPEGRQEITTEGGLDVASQIDRLKDAVSKLRDAGIIASAFVDVEPKQIRAAKECGFDTCEIHTGPYAHAFWEHGRDASCPIIQSELQRVKVAGQLIIDEGMCFNAGHALTYANVQPIAAIEGLRELHIGHSIVSRAVFTGFQKAVAEMKRLIREAASPGSY